MSFCLVAFRFCPFPRRKRRWNRIHIWICFHANSRSIGTLSFIAINHHFFACFFFICSIVFFCVLGLPSSEKRGGRPIFECFAISKKVSFLFYELIYVYVLCPDISDYNNNNFIIIIIFVYIYDQSLYMYMSDVEVCISIIIYICCNIH